MLKVRLIPVLLLKNGLLVRSENFSTHQIIGNPIHEVERFNQWNVDELIYLDISKGGHCGVGRADAKIGDLGGSLEILESVSKTCFMPLTWGGGIRTLNDIRQRILRGADKVSVNSQAFREPDLIRRGAKLFGNQAIVVNIDVRMNKNGAYEVFIDGGQTPTGVGPVEWATKVEECGAGEVLLQSIDRDGTGEGYDLKLIKNVAEAISIPVIALGGIGSFESYRYGVEAGASAVAAANLWHFKEMADRHGKDALSKAGVNVRLASNKLNK